MKLITDRNGDRYWVRHGKGNIKWTGGANYDGDWYENKMHGHGKLVHTNNEIYEGEFVDDKANGYGLYINEN